MTLKTIKNVTEKKWKIKIWERWELWKMRNMIEWKEGNIGIRGMSVLGIMWSDIMAKYCEGEFITGGKKNERVK